jgi:hypothetical protein
VAYFGALNITGNAVLYNTFTFRLPFWNQRRCLIKTHKNNPSYTAKFLELQCNIPVQGFWILTSPTYILDVPGLQHKYGIGYSECVDFLMPCQWMPEVPCNMPRPLHPIYSQIYIFNHAFNLFQRPFTTFYHNETNWNLKIYYILWTQNNLLGFLKYLLKCTLIFLQLITFIYNIKGYTEVTYTMFLKNSMKALLHAFRYSCTSHNFPT